jgi:CHAT domain-containing protein
VYLSQPRSGQALIRKVASSTDTARMPALAGRASWSLGTTILRAGGYDGAMRALRRAATLFSRIGEDENLGAVLAIEAEGQFDIGDVDRGFASLQRALATLRRHRSSVWLHNALWVGAHEAASAGLLRASARLGAEDAVVAAASGLTAQVVEARLTRARVLTRAGKGPAAAVELRAVRSELAGVPTDVRGWLAADLRMSEAMASVHTDPAAAAATLDSVVAHFRGSRRHPVLLVSAMVARAEALLAIDSLAPAAATLLRAVGILEERQDSIASVSERALMLDAARRIFDRLVMLRVGSGRYLEGLALLERGRATLGLSRVSRRMRAARKGAISSLPPRVPRGEVAIDYALIGDTLLAWTVNDSTVQLTQTAVARARVIETVERLRAAMDHRSDNALVLPLLAQLYEWLMRPLEQEIRRGNGGLILVLDGELADVPFAALFDTVTRTFLVERYSLRVVPNLASASGRRHLFDATGGARRQKALLVANPAFDPAVFPTLRPLAGAASEVRAVATMYRHVTVFAGADATRHAVTATMSTAAIVHYAGHAVFDDERPERSVLALARVSDASPSGLSAEQVASLDLRRVQLVVLSACETLRGRRGRSGGFAGLTGAFLSAGVGGVVGSLWRVDDASTRDLMVEFHRVLGMSGHPADALREAQLRLLRSPDSPRRTPAAWAGFRYVGT